MPPRRRPRPSAQGDGARKLRSTASLRFSPADVKTVREVLFERLRGMILSGYYQSGTKLREEELAGQFGVSRTPVRESLRKLESEGLVRYLPHRGVVVNQISPDDLAEIYPVRAMLEGLAARLAAQHHTDQELRTLRELTQQMNTLYSQGAHRRASRVHTRFNMALYQASHNRRLIGILSQFNDYIEHTIGRAAMVPGRIEEIRREHEAMIDAIAIQDGNAAEAAARRHVENARRVFAGEPRILT